MLISSILFYIFFIYSTLASPVTDDESWLNLKKNKTKAEKFLHEVEDYIVNFMLYTRKNPEKFFLIQVENKLSISRSIFDPSKNTKILIHGWNNAYNTNFDVTLRNAYLKRYDANVIAVDWSVQSHFNYYSATYTVGKVADVVAQLIDILVKEYKVKLSSIHIVGHSLGAHVAGIAGLRVRAGNVSRVTGLDPAAPLFSLSDADRIRPDSADFVDVIHTCGDLKGFKAALGQVDFYPNGGTFEQPGCGFDYKGSCSHARSYIYFAESINADDFFGLHCSDWDAFKAENCTPPVVAMGEYTPTWARGKYYLRTNSTAPFGLGLQIY